MIGYLRGKLLDVSLHECLIDVNGVGYAVAIPVSTFDRLCEVKGEVELFIHTQVREDAISLYGFFSKAEKELFELVIDVSGVGAKLALNILSAMPTESFAAAVANGDIKTLSSISGVGKKTAERMLLELKDKIKNLSFASAIVIDGSGQGADPLRAAAVEDAKLALAQLGFKGERSEKALRDIAAGLKEQEVTAETLILLALQSLK